MTKKAAVINDLSGFGKCSLCASIAVLSAMGIQPCPMPTAILTNQSGFSNYSCVDFTENLKSYIEIWKKNNAVFDGIYSGYISNIKQIDIISEFIDTFRTQNTLVLVDPVMADNGKVYKGYSSEMCRKMSDLAAKADFITPNLTELCILTESNYDDVFCMEIDEKLSFVKQRAHMLAEKNNQTVIVTGISDEVKINNCAFGSDEDLIISANYFDESFSGTGDLLASLVFGYMLKGENVKTALEKAGLFLEKSIADTVCQKVFDPNHGVEFEKNIYMLT